MKIEAVFGPPGTGKTTEMIKRVKECMRNGALHAREISVISFTKAAASEVASRSVANSTVNIGTLHSFCFRACEVSPMQVVNSFKLREFGRLAGVPIKGTNPESDNDHHAEGDKYMFILQRAYSEMRLPKEVYMSSDRPGSYERFVHFVQSYENWKSSNGLVDFSDMLRRYAANPVPHFQAALFFDEAQDFSKLQWSVVRAMVDQKSVKYAMIAGDDDQAIYEWAGASASGMSDFVKSHSAEASVLSQSYRVPEAVFDVANNVIARVEHRFPKVYLPRQEKGSVSRCASFETSMLDASQDTMILCRTNSIKDKVEEMLVSAQIPYRAPSGQTSPLDSPAGKAMAVLDKVKKDLPITPRELDLVVKAVRKQFKPEVVARKFKTILSLKPSECMYGKNAQMKYLDAMAEGKISGVSRITVSTIHSAKGKEADRVILLTDHTEASRRNQDENPAAEARVWYVAVTRARQTLDIVDAEDGYPL